MVLVGFGSGAGNGTEHRWLTPIILTTWEAEVGEVEIQDQPWQIVHETPSPK
jgi:hypothetical protein